MAITPAQVFAKLTISGTDTRANTVNETLGYTDINIFDASTDAQVVNALQDFVGGYMQELTTNVVKSASYSVDVDILNYEP